MATRNGTPSCVQRGLILTCYVNGRKRFRAVPATLEAPADRPTVGSPRLFDGATIAQPDIMIASGLRRLN